MNSNQELIIKVSGNVVSHRVLFAIITTAIKILMWCTIGSTQ